jgi:hypothetical protein
MPMLRVNGTELYYEDTGGSGPAILFSHGLFWDSSLHRGNETPLSTGTRRDSQSINGLK